MTTPQTSTLAAQRLALRAQLGVQRAQIAQTLMQPATSGGRYPRSATIRLLMRQPALVTKAATVLAGPHAGATVRMLLAAVDMLSLATQADRSDRY